jgi:uncharacterized membrane protein
MTLFTNIGLGFYTLLFGVASIAHFIYPAFFLKAMPPFLPLPEIANVLVGIIELSLAVAFWTKFRNIAIYIAMSLLFVFLIVIHGWHIQIGQFPSLPTMSVEMLWGRIFIQFVLIGGLWFLRDKSTITQNLK